MISSAEDNKVNFSSSQQSAQQLLYLLFAFQFLEYFQT